MVGTERKLSSFNLTAISVAGCCVLVSDKPISNLGVRFDRNLSMCNQVHQVVRSAYFHLRSIGLARKMLTVAATKQLVQKCRNGLGPGYLTSMLSAYTPVHGLRSASYGLLVEPQSRLKTVGDRAFSVVGPHEWEPSPWGIRDCQTLGAFKRKLKTHLFRAAYGL